MSDSPKSTAETLIVGGSLGGLVAALSLAAHGRSSTVLERTEGRTQRGVAILVAGADLRRALSVRAAQTVFAALGPAASRQGVYPHAWWDVYRALHAAAQEEPLITVVPGERVIEVGQNDAEAWARTARGETWTASAILGADGYRSVVRTVVDAERPIAPYAGYVVWLGQAEVPEEYAHRIGGPNFFDGDDGMLAVYPLIDQDEQVRHFGFGWFDPNRDDVFRAVGAVDGDEVKHTPRVTDLPDAVFDGLIASADEWSEPWRSGVIGALRERDVVPTPITEYLPRTVVDGRLALLGDAAHAQTPMTGAGFQEAVADAVALGEVMDDDAVESLARYEAVRLAGMQRRVSSGQSFSRSFASGAW
ncbi:MAG: NAD(P)/FAD-dependent oxidoreductase [Gordonia sp. (in: high G+C Gram-positive bacteria)]|uniref:FAD-dependent monooxygenase n=1 Tax=Gordonia sp. (in: high G+C Gram-positive bacteria) TaxID=84139 RepID=UPI0039E6C3EA